MINDTEKCGFIASKSNDDISVEDKFDNRAKYYTTAFLILQK